MAHTIKTLGRVGVFLSLLWLAACGSPTSTPAPTSAPTFDPNPLRTEVAATVYAQVTQALALTPSITPLPSPTVTSVPATAAPTEVISASPSPTATLTSGTPTTGTDNRAQWVSQTVADDTTFTPGETFTMTWTLKNVGTSTWTTAYRLRFYSGDSFSAPKEVFLPREVLPGETIDIALPMKAPARAGTYRSVWVMSTEVRSNFKEPVFLQIIVAVPVTPTRTPRP
jgi:hypothetical protein